MLPDLTAKSYTSEAIHSRFSLYVKFSLAEDYFEQSIDSLVNIQYHLCDES
jgi:hypothetical protein